MPEDDPLHDLHARLAGATKEELLELLLFHEQTLRELRAGLMEAEHYLGGKSAAWGRAAFHHALHTMNRFLHAHGLQDVSSLLVAINGALLDLEHGLTPAILARAEGDRVSPYSTHLRGYAAGIMEGLTKHARMTRAQAEEWVAKKLSAAGYEVAPLTIRHWRRVARDHKKNPERHKDYRTIIDRPEWANAPLSYAETLIARITGLISAHPKKED